MALLRDNLFVDGLDDAAVAASSVSESLTDPDVDIRALVSHVPTTAGVSFEIQKFMEFSKRVN